jgi:hypothetical protein
MLENYFGDEERGKRGSDVRLMERLRSSGCRFAKAKIPPIGRYDGLRVFSSIRWRLGVPQTGFISLSWYQPLRRWLRD